MKIINVEDLESIRKGDMAPLKAIFNANYLFCVNNLRSLFNCSESDAKDLAMDAILVLQAKIMNEEYVNQNVQSFLLTVASNKWRNKQKRDRRLMDYDPIVLEEFLISNDESEQSEFYRKKIHIILTSINDMQDPCKSLLQLNLVKGLSLDTVFELLGYKTKAVLKTTKSRCIRKLRQLINERMQ